MGSGYILKIVGAVGAVDGFKIRCERKGGSKVCDATHLKEQSCHNEDGEKQKFVFGCVQCDMPIGHLSR